MSSGPPGRRRRRALTVLQLVVGIAGFTWVLGRVDPAAARDVLRRADGAVLALAVALSFCGLAFAASRWTVLLRGAGVRYRFRQAYTAYLVGSFYGLALPGVVGGDVARVVVCRRQTGTSLPLGTATVLAERGLGVVVLLLVLAAGANAATVPEGAGVLRLAWVAGLAGVAGVVALPALLARLPAAGTPSAGSALRRLWQALAARLAPLRGERVTGLLIALVLTAGFQLTDIAVTWVVARGLGMPLDPVSLFVALPVVYLATVLPVSPAGLGVREASLALMLSGFGVAPPDAALLALAVFLNRLVVGAVAGALSVTPFVRAERGLASP